jgi:uncharacterized protein YbgA (DUF1722 family)/uncharacterized protein YbbK (DUF523 family)
MTDTIRIGVSACLLGREVRYDGQHKRDAFLVDELGPFVEYVPVCPEVEVGMPVPREPLRLVRRGPRDAAAGATRMIASRSGEDWTLRMRRFARQRVMRLARERLSGYVLKQDSPSCGLLHVKRFPDASGAAQPERDGQGLFAAELRRALPHLPVEEEGRLHDPALRESFIERIFAYHRLQALWAGRWSLRSLIAFHTANKMALLAHDEAGYRRLGRLVARAKSLPRAELRERYQAGFMAALEQPATPGRHVNVMTHMLGHFSDRLDAAARAQLLGAIEDHRRGRVPLVVPLTLIRHYVRLLDVAYLAAQTYLDPHPNELLLRNRV